MYELNWKRFKYKDESLDLDYTIRKQSLFVCARLKERVYISIQLQCKLGVMYFKNNKCGQKKSENLAFQ